MATNFPGSLDAFTNPTSTDTLDNPPHDQQHADVNDAVEALQAKVGVDGSAVTTSLDYKVAQTAAELNAIGTWQTWTPVIAQGVTVTATYQYAKYTQINKTVHAVVRALVTSSGTAGQGIGITIPVPAAYVGGQGTAIFYDASTATLYNCAAFRLNTTYTVFLNDLSGGTYLGISPAVTATSGDYLHINITYEAA